jgi:hypothetical protein
MTQNQWRKKMKIRLGKKSNMLPFWAIVREGLTHRVAVGCYALPLKGQKKKLQSYWKNDNLD